MNYICNECGFCWFSDEEIVSCPDCGGCIISIAQEEA